MRFYEALFSIVVLLIATNGVVNCDDVTSLQSIYDDLSILSRVTNAIALESAARKKSVQIRDVIAEVLQVHKGNFSELAKLDPTFLMSTVNGIQKLSNQVLISSSERISMEDLHSTLDLADLLYYIINAFENGMVLDSSVIVEELSSREETLLICEPKLVQTLASFSMILKGVIKEEHLEKDLIIEIQQSKNKIMACVEKIIDYGKTVNENSLFSSPFQELEEIADYVRDVVDKNLVDNFKKLLEKLKKIFLENMKILEVKEETRASSMIKMAIGLVTNTLKQGIFEHSQHNVLTAGFPEIEDMTRVISDIKSDWFRKKVSQGKSTKVLETALEPFSVFAKKMVNLEESWSDFSRKFRNSKDFLQTISLRLEQMEKFQYSKNEEKYLLSLIRSFQECSPEFKTGFDKKVLESFYENFKQLKPYTETIQALKEWSDEARNEFSSNTLDIFLEEFTKKGLEDESSDEMKEEIKEIINYEPAKALFLQFEILNEHQKSYYIFKNKAVNLSVSVENLVDVSGLSKAAECFKKQNFDTTQLKKDTSYLLEVHRMTDGRLHKLLKNILDKFSKMKKDLLETEDFVKGVASRRNTESNQSSLLLQLKDSQKLSSHLGNGMRILKHMAAALDQKSAIMESTKYDEKINDLIRTNSPVEYVRKFWKDPIPKIARLVQDLEQLDETAKSLRHKDLAAISQIFEEATKVQGIPEVFPFINQQLSQKNTDFMSAYNNTEILKSLDMDFSSHKGELNAALLSLNNIKGFFDDFFELSPKKKAVSYPDTQTLSVSLVIFVCLAIFFLLLFMDRYEGKNVLIDAVREINPVNLLNSIKKGAYINVCNKFGNTPLHVATKRGYVELVEILVKNGADRTFLNTQNKTPEQMIPENYHETEKEKIERFEKIEKIYSKYRNKNFKKRFPDEFPTSSFHIYIDEHTEDNLTNAFTTKFQSITSDEILPTTTHFIVKTNNDVLETDDINMLAWVFSGVIIVKESWMAECLKNKKMIAKDCNYLVEKVKYKGIVYDTVIQWSNAMAKGTTPYLCGVHVVIVMKECPNMVALSTIITNQGGTVLDRFPEKESYNKGAHPYLHNHLGPIFIIHDGSVDLTIYRNDVDKMFTILTESEFLMFMLKREINLNTSPNPMSVLVDGDD
ncbi:hypothetical protein CAEBREN_04490 [Caenorhabditis brenneri]|uniref:BRCT domain-containing protein n=1 Tax=Caenorhabditis brenneri TaxID=135651 RepID=G0MEX7_CAEBE|nr:hypothetical protein CAEBREN_04490 [Caenorhabditis brenneri]